MSQIVKTFTALMMLLFLMFTTTSMLALMTDSVSAQNLHSAMIEELENSHYAISVMEDCFRVAKDNAYQLEMVIYSRESGKVIACESTQIPQNTEGIYAVEVVLTYSLKSPFFYLNQEQTIAGYGR